ncbi:class I SAM-dependent methyltransferase [Actinocorallia sp. B10E7]|uniref:class I SAM-dependent methyltransferase n=1 Tax=Actinocorallia sp. B10E7 TaxID=3153558 RepID=UPI00325DB52E
MSRDGRGMNPVGPSWRRYLAGFHNEHAGITERVLRHSRSRGIDPYDWLLEAVPPTGRVLDLACGSAPLWPALRGRGYLGVDSSAGELVAARRTGAWPLVRADASALPLADGGFDVVVCSMALMLFEPLAPVLAEIARVLAPGGVLVATVPDRGPLKWRDLWVVAGLLGAVGAGLRYPGDEAVARLPELLAESGLRPDGDERRRFGYRPGSPDDAAALADSLYLPGLPPSRRRRVRHYLGGLARVGAEVPIPIRRIIARRVGD